MIDKAIHAGLLVEPRPVGPPMWKKGEIFYDLDTGVMKIWNGKNWETLK